MSGGFFFHAAMWVVLIVGALGVAHVVILAGGCIDRAVKRAKDLREWRQR